MDIIKQYYVIVDNLHYGPFTIEEIKSQDNLQDTTLLLDIDAQKTILAKDITALQDAFEVTDNKAKETIAPEQLLKEAHRRFPIWVVVMCFAIVLAVGVWLLFNTSKAVSVQSVTHEHATTPINDTPQESVLLQMKQDAELITANRAKKALLQKKVLLLDAEINTALVEKEDIESFHLFRTKKKRNAQLDVVNAKIEALQQEKTNLQLEINQLQPLN